VRNKDGKIERTIENDVRPINNKFELGVS